jgi:hypothetical protein
MGSGGSGFPKTCRCSRIHRRERNQCTSSLEAPVRQRMFHLAQDIAVASFRVAASVGDVPKFQDLRARASEHALNDFRKPLGHIRLLALGHLVQVDRPDSPPIAGNEERDGDEKRDDYPRPILPALPPIRQARVSGLKLHQ